MSASRVLAVVAIAAACVGQTPVIVPSKAATVPTGPSNGVPSPWPFWGTGLPQQACRVQYVFDAADVGVAAALLNGVALRGQPRQPHITATFSVEVWLDHARLPSTAASEQFASNAPTPTRVFAGPVSLPARVGAPWPTPWEAPLPFTTPWAYSGSYGAGLLVEFRSTTMSALPWNVEDYTDEHGDATIAWTNNACLHSGGSTNSQFTANLAQLVVGGRFQQTLGGLPLNQPLLQGNMLAFGTSGPGGRWAGQVLPFLLQSVGIPARPHCYWSIDELVTVVMTYDPAQGTLTTPSLPLPNSAGLIGQRFFTQAAALDGPPPYVVFPSMAVEWQIGSGARLPATTIVRTYDPATTSPTSGIVLPSRAAAMELLR